MNNKRRQKLSEVKALLSRAYNITDSVLDEEQDALDNMPENLESSSKYEKIEEAVGNLESALEKIEDAQSCINEAST